MKICFENQCASNSPSKIRGGRGALMIPIKVICRSITNAPALSSPPALHATSPLNLEGENGYQYSIFVELILVVFMGMGKNRSEES